MRRQMPWKWLVLSIGLLPGLLGGCAPRVQLALNGPAPPALPAESQVLVLAPGVYVPPGYDNLGTIRLGEAGATIGCSLPRLVELARQRARQAGANVVALTIITPPGPMTTCYTLEADLLLAHDLAAFAGKLQAARDSLRQPSLLPAGVPYAMLYAYRLAGEPLQPLDLCLNDSVVNRMHETSYYQLRLPATGRIRLKLKNQPATELVIDLEAGREYFLRCGVQPNMKAVISRPYLVAMPPVQGRAEYRALAQP